MDFFRTLPRPHFLGRALMWPGYFGEHILGLFGLHPSSLLKSAGFLFLSGKASLVCILACLFSVGVRISWKRCVELELGDEDGIWCLLPCILLLYIE